MVKLLLIMIILFIAHSSCVIPTYIGKSTLSETKVTKSNTKITSVLFVGVGSTASRFFLENLSDEIKKLFAQSQIQCDFTYAGKIPRRSHLNINKLITSQHDAYLLLNPVDTSYINTHKSVASVGSPLPGGGYATGSIIGNQYIEDYYVEFYTKNDSLNIVWQAELKVNFDVANPGRFKKIAEDIFEKLLQNGFIPKN